MTTKILVLDNEISFCDRLENLLRSNGYVTASTHNRKEALQLMKATLFAVIICDCRLRDTYSTTFLEDIRKLYPQTPVIFTGAAADLETAIELMHRGAFYFLLKPLNPEKILEVVRQAIGGEGTPYTSDMQQPVPKPVPYSYIRGKCASADKLFEELALVAPTDYTVIIQGDTGTGKESIARLLHENSPRAEKAFIPIDCGSLSKELAASELFGHEKGSFTGAVTDKTGAFELAHEGTLFLDEIGNLAYEVQLFLLRSIEEKMIRKVGGVHSLPVNVRLVVATNENLSQAVAGKNFREDLYHRLNEFFIQVPALKDRKEDLPVFINTFVSEVAKRLEKNIPGLTDKARDLLSAYTWPGNIRELKNAIKNACLRTPDNQLISEKFLPYEIRYAAKIAADRPEEKTGGRQHSSSGAPSESLRDAAIDAEREMIFQTLEKVNFNKKKAAELLNIDRKTLYNKLGKRSEGKDTGGTP